MSVDAPGATHPSVDDCYTGSKRAPRGPAQDQCWIGARPPGAACGRYDPDPAGSGAPGPARGQFLRAPLPAGVLRPRHGRAAAPLARQGVAELIARATARPVTL